MSIRKAIRQIQELKPSRYAIVFDKPLNATELQELKQTCEQANIRALLLTNARVVPLDEVFALAAKTTEAEIARATEKKIVAPDPLSSEYFLEDVTEAHDG